MFSPIAIYIASILGAIGLILMLPKRQFNYTLVGAVVAAASLGGLWLILARFLPEDLGGIQWGTFAFYYVFSGIAIAAAARVITHTRPVYSALWFVMVVLSSAGLLLTLAAEFMAFAMIIIYAGAILVTYMFVLMLASQTQTSHDDEEISATYDRTSRDPVAAVVAGFLLLAVLLNVSFEQMDPDEAARMEEDAVIAETVLANRPAMNLRERMGLDPEMPGYERLTAELDAEAERITNVERVGLDLFRSHPLGIELAGVILLVALIGAVVIARTQVEEEQGGGAPPTDETGATVHPRGEPGPDSPQAHGASGGRMGT